MNNTPKFNYQSKSMKSLKGDNHYNFDNGTPVNEPRSTMSGNNGKPVKENGNDLEFGTYGTGPGRSAGNGNPNYNSHPKDNDEVQFNSPKNNSPKNNGLNIGSSSEPQFNNGNSQPVKPIRSRNYGGNGNNNNNTNPKGNIFDSGSPTFNGGNNNSSPSINSSPSNSGRSGNSGGGTIRRPR